MSDGNSDSLLFALPDSWSDSDEEGGSKDDKARERGATAFQPRRLDHYVSSASPLLLVGIDVHSTCGCEQMRLIKVEKCAEGEE